MDRLKNQLTAAVAMSAAALIASGYLITWARLTNVEASSRAVLSALSTSYYLGVALESLLLLLVVLVVVGAVFLLAQGTERTRKPLEDWPSKGSWVVLGAVIALIGLLAAGWPISILFASHTHADYLPATIGVSLLVVGFAFAVASAGEALKLRGLAASAAAVLLLSTVAAIGFKIVDAGLGPIPFPEAAAWVPKADCVTPEAEPGHPGCGFVGFYVGEDSNWIYLVRTPLNCEGLPHFPPRLVLVPREKLLDLAVSEKLRADAPACPQTGGEEGGGESDNKSSEGGSESGKGGGGGSDPGQKGCAGGNSQHKPSTPLTEPTLKPAGWLARTPMCDSA